MPRRSSFAVRRNPRFDDLLKLLVQELKEPQPGGQPWILEDKIKSIDGLQVQVIWDEFRDVPDEQRPDLILNAYELAEGKEYRDRILMAHGLTVTEATEYGLMPHYLIWDPATIPGKSQSDQVKFCEILKGEGASWPGPVLRFPTREDADASKKRLESKLPGSLFLPYTESRSASESVA